MLSGLKYRAMELNYLMYLSRFGINRGTVHYDGQFMWFTK